MPSSHPDTALLLSRRLDALTLELQALRPKISALSQLLDPTHSSWDEIRSAVALAEEELASASAHLCLVGRGAQSANPLNLS